MSMLLAFTRPYISRVISGVIFVFLGVSCLGLPGCDATPKRPPNLILISVDTLRADHLGAYGYAGGTSPTIDALALNGTRFADASAPIPRTTQSFASLFTSRSPEAHGLLEIGERLPDDELTLAEILKAAGYEKFAVSSNGAADRDDGLDQGFDRFIGFSELREQMQANGADVQPGGLAETVTRVAAELMNDAGTAPYFLWVLYLDPHWIYDPPPPFNGNIDRKSFDFYERAARWNSYGTINYNLNGESERARKTLTGLYDGEI